MRFLAALSLGFLAGAPVAARPPAHPPTPPIRYAVGPVLRDGRLESLSIELRLAGDADGRTDIALPDTWAGADKLYTHVRDIAVRGGTRQPGPPATIVIRNAPGAALTIRYRVVGADSAPPSADYEKGRPTILPDSLFAYGESLFAAPENRGDAPARVTFARFPAGWGFASDLQHDQHTLTVDGVADSILIAGRKLRLIARPRGGAPLRFAILGDWPFTDAALADRVERIVAAEDRFWGDRPQPFLVPLYPLTGGETGRIGINGTGRGDAFAISSTTNVDLAALDRLFAHEYAHRWSPRLLGRLHDPEALDYWLSEGFTDWLAARALIDAGLWTPADFAARLDETLLRNASSAARTLPNAAVAPRFWQDDAVMQLSYDRGFLLALGWDAALRPHGGDFAAILRAMRRRARDGGLATAAFGDAMRAAGVDPAPTIARFVDRGEPLLLAPDTLGPCGTIVAAQQPAYRRGFDIAERDGAAFLVKVDPAGPAYAAGARDGQRFIKREAGRRDDATAPYIVRVADPDGVERTLRFLPAGKDMIRFQKLDLTSSDACRRWLAG